METRPAASLEYIQACEAFPLRRPEKEDKSLEVQFPLLCGESVKYLGYTANGTIALSNYRVVFNFDGSLVILPLGVIEYIESREIFFLYVFCKDGHSVRCTFSTNEACIKCYKRLQSLLLPPRRLTEDIFAFAFHAWCIAPNQQTVSGIGHRLAKYGEKKYSFGLEVDRMGFDLKGKWRISYVNDKFRVCKSYPELHIVPSAESDENIQKVANFRSSGRFPSVVWRNQRNGMIIARCSQPEIGWLGWRKEEDEQLIAQIAKACISEDDETKTCRMLIVDARSYTAAVANRAKGGGVECSEYYDNCEIQFMNLANIHSIRKSFQNLRNLLLGHDQSSWLSSLENSKWLQHISGLLRSAVIIARANDLNNQPVLIHCSDGWDRTPQLSTLTQLMLDPYYRTFEGFQVLVEREWLEFGHKFGDRCGHGVGSEDSNERCPVFLQWLDCVYQLLSQFPCAFEFNAAFLMKLVSHTYSCLFGTFLCNTQREREATKLSNTTCSVWSLFTLYRNKYKNFTYTPLQQVLQPQCDVLHLRFWSSLYLGLQTQASILDDLPAPDAEKPVSNGFTIQKTQSFDSIATLSGPDRGIPRQASDPNLLDHKFTLNGDGAERTTEPGEDSVTSTGEDGDSSAVTENCDETVGAFINGDSENEKTAETSLIIRDDESCGEGPPVKDCAFKNSTDTLINESCSSSADVPNGNLECASDLEEDGGPSEVMTNGFSRLDVSTSTTDLSDALLFRRDERKLRESLSRRDAAHIPLCNGHSECFNNQAKLNGSLESSDGAKRGCSLTPGVPPSLDEDGLSVFPDPAQMCLIQMVSDYRARVDNLQKQLCQAKAIIQQANLSNGRKILDTDEILSLPDSTGSEDNSVNSLPTSDASWENVDGESSMTLWVPDHAATHCASCYNEFWIIRRRHHCRNCGHVYCSSCTSYFTSLPDQQLYEKQRVCKQCYQKLATSTTLHDQPAELVVTQT